MMMIMRARIFGSILVLMSVVACGGGGGVTSPNAANQIPNVAGTYTGPLSWTADGVPVATISAQMNVAQAGSQLTINGTLSVNGQTFPMTAVTGSINATGYFTATSGGVAGTYDPDCGSIRGIDASLTFSGRTAQYVEHDSTTYCGNWTISGTLTR
jgi:hypothetical protein